MRKCQSSNLDRAVVINAQHGACSLQVLAADCPSLKVPRHEEMSKLLRLHPTPNVLAVIGGRVHPVVKLSVRRSSAVSTSPTQLLLEALARYLYLIRGRCLVAQADELSSRLSAILHLIVRPCCEVYLRDGRSACCVTCAGKDGEIVLA